MRLLLREFRARTGEGDGLLAVIRTAATRLVRDGVIDTVVVCQRADSREHALWLEHGTIGSPAPEAKILSAGAAESPRSPLALDLVDALYRFPLARCRVWTLETRHPAVCRALFGLSQTMQQDGRIAGLSVYRAAHEPSHAIAFLALDRDRVPAEFLGDAGSTGSLRARRDLACYPLTGIWTIGRLTPRPAQAPARYPRSAFWAQLGVSLMQATAADGERPIRPPVARRS